MYFVPLIKRVFVIPAKVSVFLSCPHYLLFATSNTTLAPSPQRRSGDPVDSQNRTPCTPCTDQAFPKIPTKIHSKYGWVSKQEGNYPSMINREKLTMFCEICSLSPSQVPQIPHTKELHSRHLQTKKNPSPALGNSEPSYQFECKFDPKPSSADRFIFK